jgi:hypothetical protein
MFVPYLKYICTIDKIFISHRDQSHTRLSHLRKVLNYRQSNCNSAQVSPPTSASTFVSQPQSNLTSGVHIWYTGISSALTGSFGLSFPSLRKNSGNTPGKDGDCGFAQKCCVLCNYSRRLFFEKIEPQKHPQRIQPGMFLVICKIVQSSFRSTIRGYRNGRGS